MESDHTSIAKLRSRSNVSFVDEQCYNTEYQEEKYFKAKVKEIFHIHQSEKEIKTTSSHIKRMLRETGQISSTLFVIIMEIAQGCFWSSFKLKSKSCNVPESEKVSVGHE